MVIKDFNELSIRVIEATKEAITYEIEGNEFYAINDFYDFVSIDFHLMEFLYTLADRICDIEDAIDDKNIECLTTLQECVKWLGYDYSLYEGSEKGYPLDSIPFDSKQQMKEYLGYISRRKRSISKKVAA